MNTENKNSYFILDLTILEIYHVDKYLEELENSLNLILARIESKEKHYKFYKKNKSRMIHLFKTDI